MKKLIDYFSISTFHHFFCFLSVFLLITFNYFKSDLLLILMIVTINLGCIFIHTAACIKQYRQMQRLRIDVEKKGCTDELKKPFMTTMCGRQIQRKVWREFSAFGQKGNYYR